MSEYVAKNVTVTRKPLPWIPACPQVRHVGDQWPKHKASARDRRRRKSRKR